MATDSILRTYGDVSIREDVMPLIEILTAQETQIFNMLGKTKAISTVHSSLVDTLATPASLAVGEGDDYTASALTTPTRLTNIVEIIAKNFRVTRTQQTVEKYSGENELSRQTKKALKEWGNSSEFDLIRSTLVSGVSGTVPKMSGIIQAISKSTNTTVQATGTVFSASILKGLMKANIDNSNGDTATDVYMGSYLKNVADDFTNKAQYVATGHNEREIIAATDMYTTGLGKVAVHYHRYVQQSADATGRVLAIRPEKLKIAVLESPYVDKDLARSGPYDSYAVVGSHTLEVRNQDSNWFASGFFVA